MRYSIFFAAAAIVVCWKDRVATWQWEESVVCRRVTKVERGGDRRVRRKKRLGGRRGRGMRREKDERRMRNRRSGRGGRVD